MLEAWNVGSAGPSAVHHLRCRLLQGLGKDPLRAEGEENRGAWHQASGVAASPLGFAGVTCGVGDSGTLITGGVTCVQPYSGTLLSADGRITVQQSLW